MIRPTIRHNPLQGNSTNCTHQLKHITMREGCNFPAIRSTQAYIMLTDTCNRLHHIRETQPKVKHHILIQPQSRTGKRGKKKVNKIFDTRLRQQNEGQITPVPNNNKPGKDICNMMTNTTNPMESL